MRYLAAVIFITLSLVAAVLFSSQAIKGPWSIQRSPKTGICYEVRQGGITFFGYSVAMAPVDDLYCERSATDS